MRLAPKKLTSSFAFSLFWLMFLALVWYLSRPPKPFSGDVASLLVGEWKVSSEVDCLFRADGTYDWIFEPDSIGTRTVFKGDYTVSGATFVLSAGKRFFRWQSKGKVIDSPFVLDRTANSLGDSYQWELYNIDKGALPVACQVRDFDKDTRQMTIQTKEESGGSLRTIPRVWTKH